MKNIEISFVKMTGAGNDFILIDNRDDIYAINWSLASPVLCNRRYGIGADGILIIEKSPISHFKMQYYNADGSFGGMCGNGGRCSARYIMDDLSLNEIAFESLNYLYKAELVNANIKLQMKPPTAINIKKVINVLNESLKVQFVDTGSPHTVIFKQSMPVIIQKSFDLNGFKEIGPAVRYNEEFMPAGSNVNIVDIIDSHTISMRTYERGVEDETLACGTGSVASAIVSALVYGLIPPVTVVTQSGELLQVQFKNNGGNISDVQLTGSAKKVFTGKYMLIE